MRRDHEFVLGRAHDELAHVDDYFAAIALVELRFDLPVATRNELKRLWNTLERVGGAGAAHRDVEQKFVHVEALLVAIAAPPEHSVLPRPVVLPPPVMLFELLHQSCGARSLPSLSR